MKLIKRCKLCKGILRKINSSGYCRKCYRKSEVVKKCKREIRKRFMQTKYGKEKQSEYNKRWYQNKKRKENAN